MKTKIKTILIIILIVVGIFLYDQHQEVTRVKYAQVNNCSWTIYGSHYICK